MGTENSRPKVRDPTFCVAGFTCLLPPLALSLGSVCLGILLSLAITVPPIWSTGGRPMISPAVIFLHSFEVVNPLFRSRLTSTSFPVLAVRCRLCFRRFLSPPRSRSSFFPKFYGCPKKLLFPHRESVFLVFPHLAHLLSSW